jgi:hypothetical protein
MGALVQPGPVAFEELYYNEINGTLPDVAASKLAA